MYLAGTWNGGLGSMLHYRYDIVADAWTQMANVPVNIYRPASASIGTNTYLVGGGDPSVAPRASPQARKLASTRAPATSFNTTYVYDTLADTWSSGPNTNVAHSFTGGTAIGNSLIVVTGFDGGGDTNTVEKSDCGGGGVTPTPTPTPCSICLSPTPTSTPTPLRLRHSYTNCNCDCDCDNNCHPTATPTTTQDLPNPGRVQRRRRVRQIAL
jgi:hypothetical protein